MTVTPRFVTNTNAWREEEETDDLYSYLTALAALSPSDEELEGAESNADAKAAAAYVAAAPPRRLEQLSRSNLYTTFPPLLPERNKTGEDGGSSRRLEVCPEEFTTEDTQRRDAALKRAGFTSDMACDVTRASIVTRSIREQRENERLQPLTVPPQYLPPMSPGCKGDPLCGQQYCALVDCTRG